MAESDQACCWLIKAGLQDKSSHSWKMRINRYQRTTNKVGNPEETKGAKSPVIKWTWKNELGKPRKVNLVRFTATEHKPEHSLKELSVNSDNEHFFLS